MADIFDVAPPAWLQRATQQTPGELGALGGTLAGGFLNALQKDPNAPAVDPATGQPPSWMDSRKGLKEGLAEARLNEDPQWKLKTEALKSQVFGAVIQNEMQYSKLKEQNQELAAWQQAFPKASAWLSATPEQRLTMPVPDTGGSKQLLSAIQKTRQQDEILAYRKAQADTAKMRAENSLFDVKEGAKAVEPLGAAARSRIGPPKGPNGTYTPEQWGKINEERAVANLPPAGTPTGVITEQEREKGREKLAGIKGTQQETLESEKQKNRLELEGVKAKDREALQKSTAEYKIDLTKLQASLKTAEKGKTVTKGEFVNRQLHGVYSEIMRNGVDSEKAAKLGLSDAEFAMRQARDILEKLYDTSKAFTPPAAAAAPTAAPTTGTTNAPPAAPDKDPLGLFK